MTIEHVKAFGTWLSNMLYWVLEPVFGRGATEVQATNSKTENGRDALERHQKLMNDMDRTGLGIYSTRGEALFEGGMGVKVGDDRYM